MRWLVRIAAIAIGLLALLIVGTAALFFIDATFGKKVADYSNVSFTAPDGTTVQGYLAQPNEPGTYPAVIMIHEFWGLNDKIQNMADDLAARGYVVLAPDTYRGQTTDQIPRAIYLRLDAPEARVMNDLQGAFDYLASQPNVDAQRIAVLGFCYGGEMALQHALRNPALAATVVFYGSPVTNAQGLGALLQTKRPVLGIFAQNDQQIPPAAAQAFQNALDAAGIPNTVTIYPGVGHAFVQPESIHVPGAAADAWQQTIQFLETNLKNKPSSALEFVNVAVPGFTTADFRVRTLSRGAGLDVVYLCTVALSHLHPN